MNVGGGGTFTQADVDAFQITYTHQLADSTTADFFTFTVQDLDNVPSASSQFDINFDPVPTFTQSSIAVTEGSATAVTIATANLQASDDTATGASLVFTLTTLPTKGTLKLNGSNLAVNGTFTQADIDTNKVTFTSNGTEGATDSFNFGLSDGVTSVSGTYNITDIVATDDLSVVSVSTAKTVIRNVTGVIVDEANLVYTDPDTTDPTNIEYEVVIPPSNGVTVLKSGVALVAGNTFTQTDLNDSTVITINTTVGATSSSLVFKVHSISPAGTFTSNQTFTITVALPPTGGREYWRYRE